MVEIVAIATARFLSLLFAALAPALAHRLELSNKIGLSRDEQSLARGSRADRALRSRLRCRKPFERQPVAKQVVHSALQILRKQYARIAPE